MELVQEQRRLILVRLILHIFILFVSLTVYGQTSEKEKVWKNESRSVEYKKKKGYKGPKTWYGEEPSEFSSEDIISENNYDDYTERESLSDYDRTVDASPEELLKDRQRRFGENAGELGEGGEIKRDPSVKPPDPIEIPEFESPDFPDYDGPDIDLNKPNIPPNFWKTLLIILIAGVVLFLIYYFIKNKKPTVVTTVVDVEDEWNPEIITKTELDVKLEEALSKGDFRQCIRVYFTFILKELIKQSLINWKREKTNWDYSNELIGTHTHYKFTECVRLYDLVWYGDYEINEDVYNQISPKFKSYYQSLNPSDD